MSDDPLKGLVDQLSPSRRADLQRMAATAVPIGGQQSHQRAPVQLPYELGQDSVPSNGKPHSPRSVPRRMPAQHGPQAVSVNLAELFPDKRKQRQFDRVLSTLQSSQTSLADKLKAYRTFKGLDYTGVRHYEQLVPALDARFKGDVVGGLYRDAQSLANRPITENLATLLSRVGRQFDAAGITGAHVYGGSFYLAALELGAQANALVARIDQKVYDVSLDGTPDSVNKIRENVRCVQTMGAHVVELTELAKKARTYRTPVQPTPALHTFYTTALTYVGSAMESLLNKPDEELFSRVGLDYFSVVDKVLENIVNANETLKLDLENTGVSYTFKNPDTGETRQATIPLEPLIESVDTLRARYAERKDAFTQKVKKTFKEKAARAAQLFEPAIERYSEMFQLPVSDTPDMERLLHTSHGFRDALHHVAGERMQDLLRYANEHSAVLGYSADKVNGFIDCITEAYQNVVGRTHPLVQMRIAKKRYDEAMELERIREADELRRSGQKKVEVDHAVILSALKDLFTQAIPRWAYAAVAAVGLASGVAYHALPHTTVQRTEGHLVGDVNNDGNKDLVMITVEKAVPFTLGYSVAFGTKDFQPHVSTLTLPPRYVRTFSDKEGDNLDYTPSVFRLRGSCGDLVVNDYQGNLLRFPTDCSGNFRKPFVLQYASK